MDVAMALHRFLREDLTTVRAELEEAGGNAVALLGALDMYETATANGVLYGPKQVEQLKLVLYVLFNLESNLPDGRKVSEMLELPCTIDKVYSQSLLQENLYTFARHQYAAEGVTVEVRDEGVTFSRMQLNELLGTIEVALRLTVPLNCVVTGDSLRTIVTSIGSLRKSAFSAFYAAADHDDQWEPVVSSHAAALERTQAVADRLVSNLSTEELELLGRYPNVLNAAFRKKVQND